MKYPILGIAASVALLAAWSHPATAPRQSVTYTAHMTAAMETPANTSKGTGTATLTLTGDQLHYTITVEGLSGPATAAHIHAGKAGVAGPPVLGFKVDKVAAGKLAEGTVDIKTGLMKGVSADSLKALLNSGDAYVNVHTAEHKAGEIRGQVMKK